MNPMRRSTILFLLLTSTAVVAQQTAPATAHLPLPTTAADAANSDTSYIDAKGAAHVTRVIPLPDTISPQAQLMLSHPEPDQGPQPPLAARRSFLDGWTAQMAGEWRKIFPVSIGEEKIAGVPVRIITPDKLSESNRDKVLMNLHGGGFDSDSGSYTESIPIAGIAGIKVVAVLYRLAPEHPFPAAVDDAVTVYKELLKTYKPEHIVIYGTSAGAILTAEVAVKLKELGLPLPAALGIFSGIGDFAHVGDSAAMYTLTGLSGHLDPPKTGQHGSDYATTTDRKDPVLSPIYADLRGLPPSLFITSGRDLLLSGTVNLHRAYLNAGVDARLIVFDALPHAFWYDPALPESLDANHKMADFFVRQLDK